jgi:hypothetical protein
MHVPVEVAERARAVAEEHGVDVLVSVGGGSTTGLAKAVALTTGLPIVAVPTTYAGSEATNVWGLTEGAARPPASTAGAARVGRVRRQPAHPARRMSVASGLNALAHCVDSMWAPRADPIDQALALEGIRALATGPADVVAATRRASRARADAVRRLPRRRRVRLGRLRAAPQDLPRPRRHVQPAARADPRGRAAVRAGLQRPAAPDAGAPDGRRPSRADGARRAAALREARWTRRGRCATTAARGRHRPGAVRPILAGGPGRQPRAGHRREPDRAAAGGVGRKEPDDRPRGQA